MPVHESATVVRNLESKFTKGERRIQFQDNDTWYGASAALEGDLAVGNEVKVGYELKGTKATIVKLRVLGANAAVAKAHQTKDEYWAEKETYQRETVEPRITYANSRDHALRLLQLQHDTGLLDLGTKATNKAKKAAAFAVLLDLYTAKFFEDSMTLGAVTRIAEQVEESTDFDAESFEDPDDE